MTSHGLPNSYPLPPGPMQATPGVPEIQHVKQKERDIEAAFRKIYRHSYADQIYAIAAHTGRRVIERHGYKPILGGPL